MIRENLLSQFDYAMQRDIRLKGGVISRFNKNKIPETHDAGGKQTEFRGQS